MTTITKQPSPETVLAELKAKLGTRAHQNLDNVHAVCRAISNEPGDPARKDYSLATIGKRLTQQQKGPSYNTLQTPTGGHFKTLIRAWADYQGALMVKHTIPRIPTADDELLRHIPDIALRSSVGFRLAQGRRALAELDLLKGKTTLTVDMRPKDGLPHAQGTSLLPVEPSFVLSPSEREVIEKALDERHLDRFGITISGAGEYVVKDKALFGAGFAPILRNVLQHAK